MVTSSASKKALNDGVSVNNFGRSFVKNADELFVNSFGTSKAVDDKNKSVNVRLKFKKIEISGIRNIRN